MSPAEGLEDVRRETMQNAWHALRMIREAIETLGPPGVLPSQEAVLKLYGPEPVHEATAIVNALRTVLAPHGA
jgi:hypothetical protein